jgi:hypothetical protein
MKVALYIKTKKQYDPSLDLVIEKFEDRVLADGGTFEAFNCLKSEVDSLGGVYGIALNTITDFSARVLADGGVYESENCLLNTINDLGGVVPAVAETDFVRRIELFEDEKISVTSSIQNVNDISKVFTDYSQSFTIPASDNNNEIFRHWYENSLDNGFDQRLRYDGYIEIDTQTFRVGKWQLESATIKNNRVEDYKITFYGELKSLTDKFGEDKLKDIQQLNDYTIAYSGANVQNSITTTGNPDIIFPLISSDRVWQYGSGSENIGNSSHKINYTELYPSLKVARIFNAIESKYGITLNGNFLSQTRFDLAYLWLKNNDGKTFIPFNEPKTIEMDDINGVDYNISNNEIDIFSFGDNQFYTNFYYQLIVTFSSSTISNILVYKDDELYTTVQQIGTINNFVVDENLGTGRYRFEVQANTASNYTYNYSTYIYVYDPIGQSGFETIQSVNDSGSLNSNIDFSKIMPDIKVADFFSGILKMFNLTAFSTDGVNFTLEQLENWYYQGTIKDFSEYTITDFNFERIKPYKKVNFQYEKSENLLSRNFFTSNSREYGNLTYPFNNDGSDYNIKLPFENLLFNKFTGTNLQVGYALKSDLNPYAPKPIILYKYENTSCSFYLNDGTGTNHITNYNVMGQDVLYQSQTNSLNWGIEISSYLLSPVQNSLFNNYYLAYLNNLYLLKSRMVKVKMRLPYLELLNLKLNDRIIIRDKRYIINSYTTDLITFESNFELIQDFRSVNFNNSTLRQTDNTGKIIDISTTSATPLTWSIESDIDAMFTGISFNDLGVKIEIKPNASGLERTAAITSNLNDRIIIVQDA